MNQDTKNKVIVVGVVLVIGVFLFFGLFGEYTSKYFAGEDATWHLVESFTKQDLENGPSKDFYIKGTQVKVVFNASIDPDMMLINQDSTSGTPLKLALWLRQEKTDNTGGTNFVTVRNLEYEFINSSSISGEVTKDNDNFFGTGETHYEIYDAYTSPGVNWTVEIYDFY